MPSISTEKSTDTPCPAYNPLKTGSVVSTTKHASDSFSRILKNTGLLGGVQVLYVLISILRNKVAAVFIGEAGMGLTDLYARTIEFLGNATNFGIAFSAVRKLSEQNERATQQELAASVQTIRSWILLVALLGALVCALLAHPLSQWLLHSPEYTTSFLCLAPAVALTTLTGGEIAILKGMRRLKSLAANSILSALATLFIATPIYWHWGINGIVAVVLLTSTAMFALSLRATCRVFPYRIACFHRSLWREGGPLLQLGMAYVVAGIMSSGVEMLIRSFIVASQGGLAASGLYAVGLTLIVSYARLIFVSMDADYFPRLSAIVKDTQHMNIVVNRQIDILVMFMAPFLIVFALCQPLIVRLLYTAHFLPVVPMVICALPYMFFKAIYSPIAYLSLASGDSRTYMCMELIYDVFVALFVLTGYAWGGLLGAGLGLSLTNLIDLLLLSCVYRRRYAFQFDPATLLRVVVHGVLLFLALIIAFYTPLVVRCLLGGLVFIISAGYTWQLLRRETQLYERILAFFRRFSKKHKS